ncbi:proteasome activator complex subunit 4 [Biomphalaria pfeifferi]|uniref:Proteasome activator complex subunit 4 n=1 Tax=Biomphalaria pfeifferi TaxID=112525 RepID=A0AAD8AWP9_BIOPF|nr:proteasome activator complex subunit 4 [Biomphalaria pfeifferi]
MKKILLLDFVRQIPKIQIEVNDEDLKHDFELGIKDLSKILLPKEYFDVALPAIKEVSGLKSWHARANILNYMQPMLEEHFEKLRIIKVTMINGSSIKPVPLQGLVKKHAGILGLSACVQAYPYDVPDFIPQVLANLSVHVNDPQPIGMTVTKTLSNFRRTHHDNWHDHKRMFTNDHLEMITDILISHNHYA